MKIALVTAAATCLALMQFATAAVVSRPPPPGPAINPKLAGVRTLLPASAIPPPPMSYIPVTFGAGISSLNLQIIAPAKFTLTPAHPVIAESGYLQFTSVDYYSETSTGTGTVTLRKPESTVGLSINNPVQGQTYVIDVAVKMSSASCVTTVIGGAGQKLDFPRTDPSSQHLVFALTAPDSKYLGFGMLSSCIIDFYGVTVAPVQT